MIGRFARDPDPSHEGETDPRARTNAVVMSASSKGRGARPRSSRNGLAVIVSVVCAVYVAARMVQYSNARNALIDDLEDADAAGSHLGEPISLTGLPRLEDDASETLPMRRGGVDEVNVGPELLGQLDGAHRGVVSGWGCEVGEQGAAGVLVFVDGFLVSSPHPKITRGDKMVGKMCAAHPYASARVGFSAPLPPLTPGAHEIRVFVVDGTRKFKTEIGGSPHRYEEMPSALAVSEELANKDTKIREQNRLIMELQNQLGSDAELWHKTKGFGDGASADWSPRRREADILPGAASREAAHAMHEFSVGGANAGVRADGHVTHAVTLASSAGKPGGTERLLAFVGVNTGFASKRRRDVLRRTWFPSGQALKTMETENGILFRFVIGEPSPGDKALNRMLEAEISEHGDFFRLRHTDTYNKLSDKTVMWFSAAVTTVEADFYLKVDDDIHLRVPALGRFLVSHRLTRSMYFGCMKTGPVLSNPKMKWHEPEWWRFGDSGNKYFRHGTGQIYGVSRVVAQYIHDHRSILHRFANEDVSVGAWVFGLDVEFVDERNLCCQDCRGDNRCIATFQWRCSGVCDPLTNIPVIHKSCPQLPAESALADDTA